MRWFFITLIASGLLLISMSTATVSYGQVVVKGRVIDTETGKPLQGAHVFLSGTKVGSSTDPAGRYKLRNASPGGHRLVVSMIGYDRRVVDFVLDTVEVKTMDFGLMPVVYEMNEIFVGNLDRKWRKHLERFRNLFLGETKWADSVKILNPEVLRFESRWWGRFSAEALAPLQIENQALGYRITYYLDEFNHNGTRTRWDGEPLFTEMTSADPVKQARWEKNRRDAFYGSMRHFLIALLKNRVQEEGFVLYNLRPNIHGISPDNRTKISQSRIIGEGREEYLYRLRFYGKLEIIYTQKKEDWRYVRWVPNLNRGPAGNQTSYLELNERPITVDADGEIIEPYGATQSGYFAFRRLADLTPREYRPDDYGAISIKKNSY